MDFSIGKFGLAWVRVGFSELGYTSIGIGVGISIRVAATINVKIFPAAPGFFIPLLACNVKLMAMHS